MNRVFIIFVEGILLLSAVNSFADIKNWKTGHTIEGTESIVPGPNLDLSNWNTASRNLNYALLDANDLDSSNFSNSWLSYANFKSSNLYWAIFQSATLGDANFSNANLTNASFDYATLTNANFNDALVRGANFSNATGFTRQQLYSTASYKVKDLYAIHLRDSDYSGWNFQGQNLTSGAFSFATMTGSIFAGANLSGADSYSASLANADFNDAVVTGANFGDTTRKGFTKQQLYSTASYKAKNLSGSCWGNDVSGWSFVGQNLTGATFYGVTITNTDFNDAVVTATDFGGATSKGFIQQQLYSTLSYKSKNLSGIRLDYDNNLSGWNFMGQNLTDASFYGATITNTDFSFADLRGAYGTDTGSPISHNTIGQDGTIVSLQLQNNDILVVRNYPMPITVENTFSMSSGTVLKLMLSDSWQSTISVNNGVIPSLNGTLDLEFANGTDWRTLIGKQFIVFNWNGQLQSGSHFAHIQTVAGVAWDMSQLYSDGIITLQSVPCAYTITGDFNNDCRVDFSDLSLLIDQWLDTCGNSTWCNGYDINHSGRIEFRDFATIANKWLIDCYVTPENTACVPQ